MRPGTEQCGSQIAVGRGGQGGGRRSGRQEEEEDEEDEDEDARKRKAADIKSNNPHLAGGEKQGGTHHIPHAFARYILSMLPMQMPYCAAVGIAFTNTIRPHGEP